MISVIPGKSPTIRTLLVGYGEMGSQYHRPTLMSYPDAEIVGVVRESHTQGANELPLFTDLKEALQEARPDLAIIATPHYLHATQTQLCLEHGCHVLTEKPIALTYQEAEGLVRMAEKRDLLFVVGLQRRYEGQGVVFRRLQQEGRLGRIQLVHGLFAHRFAFLEPNNWRHCPEKAGAGILHDSAFHLIDLLHYYAGGEMKNLQSNVLRVDKTRGIHSFTCTYNTNTGVTVSACGSYLSPNNSVQEEISIFGSLGSLFIRRFCRERNIDPPIVFYKSFDGTQKDEFDISHISSGRSLPLQAMLMVLTGRASREILLTEAKHTLVTHRVIEQIEHQSNSMMTGYISI